MKRIRQYLLAMRAYFRALRAKWRNEDKLKKQTHLRQKRRRFIRPANVQASRTANFKRRYGIA